MSDHVITIGAKWSRRMPDPTFEGAETHFILTPAVELPAGIPKDANPREQNTNRPVYRDVAKSLRQEDDNIPGSFHLKHRGITLIASRVTKRDQKRPDGLDQLELHFPSSGPTGIVDGGHSYELVREQIEADAVPLNEYIKLEVITGLPDRLFTDIATDIAGGRNTSLQVQAKSLLDLNQKFEFFKETLSTRSWRDRVAWHENQDGEVDVTDVIAILSCFDTASYPDRNNHPVDAYRRKKAMLESFKRHPERFERLVPIVCDVLHFHDWIAYDAEDRWQEMGGRSGSGGRYGKLDMVETTTERKTTRPDFTFPFLDGLTSGKRLRRPAIFPIMASFRQLVEEDPAAEPVGQYQPVKWREDYAEVQTLWTKVGGKLLKVWYEHYMSTGRDLHVSGRSPALWDSLYKELQLTDAEDRGLFT